MSVELDHVIVPARDRDAAAGQLARLLDVPWDEAGAGHFAAVYVNDGLTLDFADEPGDMPSHHYCFRVSDSVFDEILARIRAEGIDYRSTPGGPVDHRVNTGHGGRNVYWDQPDGHAWEILTVSYARRPGDD